MIMMDKKTRQLIKNQSVSLNMALDIINFRNGYDKIQRNIPRFITYTKLVINGDMPKYATRLPTKKINIGIWNMYMRKADRPDLVVTNESGDDGFIFDDDNEVFSAEDENEEYVYDPASSEHPTEDAVEKDEDIEIVTGTAGNTGNVVHVDFESGTKENDIHRPKEDETKGNENNVDETQTTDSFDANTGFINPEEKELEEEVDLNLDLNKTAAITFDNEKLATATFDKDGNLIADDIDKAYNHFIGMYPKLKVICDIAKEAGLRIYIYDYPPILMGDIVDVDNNVVNKILIDPGLVYLKYQYFIMTTVFGNNNILDEVPVAFSDKENLKAIITRNVSSETIEAIRKSYPECLRKVIKHVDMSSYTKKINMINYGNLITRLGKALEEANIGDKEGEISCRFRFEETTKSSTDFKLICDENVKYLPVPKEELLSDQEQSIKEKRWITFKNNKSDFGKVNPSS